MILKELIPRIAEAIHATLVRRSQHEGLLSVWLVAYLDSQVIHGVALSYTEP
jgi:hypothetical protein